MGSCCFSTALRCQAATLWISFNMEHPHLGMLFVLLVCCLGWRLVAHACLGSRVSQGPAGLPCSPRSARCLLRFCGCTSLKFLMGWFGCLECVAAANTRSRREVCARVSVRRAACSGAPADAARDAHDRMLDARPHSDVGQDDGQWGRQVALQAGASHELSCLAAVWGLGGLRRVPMAFAPRLSPLRALRQRRPGADAQRVTRGSDARTDHGGPTRTHCGKRTNTGALWPILWGSPVGPAQLLNMFACLV